jgi:predicted enzyme related to lactoylglutathione lyase
MKSQVTGFNFNLIYVDDLEKALTFYQKYFGFTTKFTMDDNSHWGPAADGKINLWIGGGYKRADTTERSTRSSIMYSVASAGEFFAQLKADGVPTMQAEPQAMGEGDFWFQFMDPAGNILEALGGK